MGLMTWFNSYALVDGHISTYKGKEGLFEQ